MGIPVPVLWYPEPTRTEIATRTRTPHSPSSDHITDALGSLHWLRVDRFQSRRADHSLRALLCPAIPPADHAHRSPVPLRFSILLNVAPFLLLDHVYGTI